MKFARHVQFTLKNGKVDEFNLLMTKEILPLLKHEKGFREELTLLRGTTGTSITVWDDRAAAEAYNTKTYPTILKKLHPVLDGTPRVDSYDTVLTSTRDVVHA